MSSALTRHVILNAVDAPLKILIWTKGELGLFCMPLLLGLMFNQAIVGICISIVNYRLFKCYRAKFGKDQSRAVRYWFLPHAARRQPAAPPSYIREYIG